MFCVPQNSYVEILTPKVMVLGSRVLGGDEDIMVEPLGTGLVLL